MRVRFTRKMGYYRAGDTPDLPPDIAKRALTLGRAVRPSETETATRRPPENAAARTRRPEEEPAVCGAELDSGGTCSRDGQKKYGGRCWQHESTDD